MSKIITYTAPVKDPETGAITMAEKRGTVALLKIGGKKVKFVLQIEEGQREADQLVHWASGYRVGSLNDMKVRAYAGRGSSITDRRAAEMLLDSLINKHGVDRVLAVINSAPVYNGAKP